MSTGTFLQSHPDGTYLHVKVQPRASKNEVGPVLGPELKIRVTSPPVDAAANDAVLELLADLLDCPRSSLSIVRGQTSRHKVLFVRGVKVETIQARLGL
jgi:uncharacterized protein (TIGR00251 family)